MAKILFSKKGIQASSASKSTVFKKIMENKNIARVVNTAKEKKDLYNAIRYGAQKEGLITKNAMRRALGELENSKNFSREERRVVGKELVGGSASSRVIHENEPAGNTASEKPKVDMGKVMQEIRDKKNQNMSSAKVEPKALDFKRSNGNLRNFKQTLDQEANKPAMQSRLSSVLGYVKRREGSEEDTARVRDMLARIHEKPANNDETDLDAKQ
jgi:hypothetical protein